MRKNDAISSDVLINKGKGDEIVTVRLKKSQCKNVADFIEFGLIDQIREDEGIDNILWIEDMIGAMRTLEEVGKDGCLIKHLEAAQPKWISVKDRLPEVDVDVLLYGDGVIEIGWRDARGELGSPCIEEVTHWMPLPEPPEEEG